MKPLVSCICVTRDRRSFIGDAIKAFLSQDWREKELIVIDDGRDKVKDLCAALPNCNYVYLPGAPETQLKIGPKRNLACETASGEIIAHWDDDDWSAPERLREQVRNLFQSRKAVTGYNSMLFWDGIRAFKYKGASSYAIGTSLCYLKSFWAAHRFITEDHRQLEDNAFVMAAQREHQIAAFDGARTMVARIHAGNTEPKRALEYPAQWPQVDMSEIPDEFFKAAVA